MKMSDINVAVKGQEYQPGMIGQKLGNVFEDLSELAYLLSEIENLVFIPRPVECDASPNKAEPVNEIVTVSGKLDSIHARLQELRSRTGEVSEALGSQLDPKTRLV
jgi:hypothetical protein